MTVPAAESARSDPSGRCIEDVRVGETLPELELDVTLTTLVMYAGATWDFHRLHYDPSVAAAHGMRAPVMDGQMIGALIARQLSAWAGPDAFLRRLGYRLRQPVVAGDRIVLAGSVRAVELEHGLASCEVDVRLRDGSFVVQRATASIQLPARRRAEAAGPGSTPGA